MLKIFMLALYYAVGIRVPSRSACLCCSTVRSWLVSYIFEKAGRNLNIASGVRFGTGRNISIGDNSGLGENCYLVAMDKIVIGDDVMIAPEVMMLTGGHGYSDSSLLLREHKSVTAPIVIGNDCWIGARALLLPGVSICDRVIVAAGSVVTKSISESGVYAGNPARKVKDI